MSDQAASFVGSIPENYDRGLGGRTGAAFDVSPLHHASHGPPPPQGGGGAVTRG